MKSFNDSAELAPFYGTEMYHYAPFTPKVAYTDGVKELREHGLNWFVDRICAELHCGELPNDLRTIKLKRVDDTDNFVIGYTASLNGEDRYLASEPFFSDFEYDELTIMVGLSPMPKHKYILCLPAEY